MWELIQREFFYDSSESPLARVIGYLIEWVILSIVFFLEFLLISEGSIIVSVDSIGILDTVLPVHISELIECEYLPTLSDTPIRKKYWATRVFYLDNDGYEDKKWS